MNAKSFLLTSLMALSAYAAPVYHPPEIIFDTIQCLKLIGTPHCDLTGNSKLQEGTCIARYLVLNSEGKTESRILSAMSHVSVYVRDPGNFPLLLNPGYFADLAKSVDSEEVEKMSAAVEISFNNALEELKTIPYCSKSVP
jgi:hypothetical protein